MTKRFVRVSRSQFLCTLGLAMIVWTTSGRIWGNETDLVGKISITISTDKSIYVPGEIIYLDYTITNLTSHELTIPRPRPDAFLVVRVVDATGTDVLGGGLSVHWAKPPSLLLHGNERHTITVDLQHFGNTEEVTALIKTLLPGTYRVWLELGNVKSNTLQFQVAPLSIDQTASGNGLNAIIWNRSRKTHMEVIAELRNYLQRYQKSVHVPNAYIYLITYLYNGDKATNTEHLKEASLSFIREFPNHGLTDKAVYYYRLGLEIDAGKVKGHSIDPAAVAKIDDTLRRLQKEFPNTRVSRFIQASIAKSAAEAKKH